jgi:hypothetical protein
VHFVADHELYGEWTPVEGFRISLFAGYQSLYISDPGFSYIYGGLEPAFSVRRSFYEFAVGLGLAYGGSITDAKSDVNGHGLLVRPFVEARFYPCDIFAIYLRLAFSYYKEFGFEFPNDWDLHDANNKRSDYEDKLSYAGPNVAVGFRFGDYATPLVVVPDSDGDGVLDDIDDCKDVSGEEQFNGCRIMPGFSVVRQLDDTVRIHCYGCIPPSLCVCTFAGKINTNLMCDAGEVHLELQHIVIRALFIRFDGQYVHLVGSQMQDNSAVTAVYSSTGYGIITRFLKHTVTEGIGLSQWNGVRYFAVEIRPYGQMQRHNGIGIVT